MLRRSSRWRIPWCRHQVEAFSALLALCAGIHQSPVNSPHKGQWRGALMFFFYLRPNKRLSKQSIRRRLETPWLIMSSLWCTQQELLIKFDSSKVFYLQWNCPNTTWLHLFIYFSNCGIFLIYFNCVISIMMNTPRLLLYLVGTVMLISHLLYQVKRCFMLRVMEMKGKHTFMCDGSYDLEIFWSVFNRLSFKDTALHLSITHVWNLFTNYVVEWRNRSC